MKDKVKVALIYGSIGRGVLRQGCSVGGRGDCASVEEFSVDIIDPQARRSRHPCRNEIAEADAFVVVTPGIQPWLSGAPQGADRFGGRGMAGESCWFVSYGGISGDCGQWSNFVWSLRSCTQ